MENVLIPSVLRLLTRFDIDLNLWQTKDEKGAVWVSKTKAGRRWNEGEPGEADAKRGHLKLPCADVVPQSEAFWLAYIHGWWCMLFVLVLR